MTPRPTNPALRARALGAIALLAVATSPALANSTVTLQDREQAACYNDVQTLCGDAVPDVEKTEACMLTNRSKVSAGCARFFPPQQPAG